MKKLLHNFLMIFAVIAAFAIPLQAQTYDSAVTVVEGSTFIRYTGSAEVTTTESTYTQAMFLADASANYAFIAASLPDVTGTEDVNVLVEFSNDLLNWTAGGTTVIDQLTTTARYDTLNSVAGTEFTYWKGSVWFRLVFDGQTGNPTNTASWNVILPKNAGAPLKGAANAVNRRT